MWPLSLRPCMCKSSVNSTRLWYFLVCQKHSWHNASHFFSCADVGGEVDKLGGTASLKILRPCLAGGVTHQRSPRSWHTRWPGKACSWSPSPEEGRGSMGREEGKEEWENKIRRETTFQKRQWLDNLSMSCNSRQLTYGERVHRNERKHYTTCSRGSLRGPTTQSGIHKVESKTTTTKKHEWCRL